jgi:bacteriocin-like protein
VPVEADGESMNVPSSNNQAQPTQLRDNELNAVIGGHQKFQYETMDGRTYAIGRINGSTLKVRVE